MANTFTLAVAPDHPAFAGHFPGAPIVPGVLLLDWVLSEIEMREQVTLLPGALSVAKFLAPVQPRAELAVSYERSAAKIHCRIECRQQLVATATFAVSADGCAAS